jgi:hypothetical protein
MPGFLRASVLLLVAAVLIAGAVVHPAFSDVNKAHVEALWKDYVVATKRLQVDVAKMLGDRWPELQNIARLRRDREFARIELRNMQFQYLLEFDPDRIVYDGGLSQFANFEWRESDSEALRETNPDFVKLEKWSEFNSERLTEHPDRVVVRERLTDLEQNERYLSMIHRFEAQMDDLESALDTIAEAQKRAERTKMLKSQIGR